MKLPLSGMGFAKAAELNRYPGPSHALELAERIGITEAQRERLAAIMRRHKADAQARLRAEHLKTHLESTAVLTPGQVERYVKARGY